MCVYNIHTFYNKAFEDHLPFITNKGSAVIVVVPMVPRHRWGGNATNMCSRAVPTTIDTNLHVLLL
jgi:hypothetical protein